VTRIKIDPADAAAGAILIAVGIFFAAAGKDLSLGTVSSMGTGYFPRAISIFVMAIGGLLVVRSFFSPPTALEWQGLFPIVFVSLSLIVFAVSVERFGLIIAVTASVLVARLPLLRERPIESLVLAAGLAAGTSILFPYLLGLPMQVFPD
jgi:putative tricarboxylic transport membrane protein